MNCDAVGKPVAKRWYVVDLVLFGGFALAYVGFFAAISLMDYLDGLRGGSKSCGPFGHWGVEIGPEDMPIPPTQPMRKVRSPNGDVYYEDGEYRLPLTPGAYVWHELQ